MVTYEITMTFRSANCSLIVWEDEDTITVSSLYSEFRRRGHATELMQRVIELADAMDRNLILRVQPYGDDERIEKKRLIEFYEKFGFVKSDNDVMSRSRKNQGL